MTFGKKLIFLSIKMWNSRKIFNIMSYLYDWKGQTSRWAKLLKCSHKTIHLQYIPYKQSFAHSNNINTKYSLDSYVTKMNVWRHMRWLMNQRVNLQENQPLTQVIFYFNLKNFCTKPWMRCFYPSNFNFHRNKEIM